MSGVIVQQHLIENKIRSFHKILLHWSGLWMDMGEIDNDRIHKSCDFEYIINYNNPYTISFASYLAFDFDRFCF